MKLCLGEIMGGKAHKMIIQYQIKFQNDLNFHFLISSNAVLDNVIERIDRALPELELLENRGKWEDVLMEYGTMWKDAMKE